MVEMKAYNKIDARLAASAGGMIDKESELMYL